MPYNPGVQDISGQLYGQGIAALGQGIGNAVSKYYKNKEEMDLYSSIYQGKMAQIDQLRRDIEKNPGIYGDISPAIISQIQELEKFAPTSVPKLKGGIAQLEALSAQLSKIPEDRLNRMKMEEMLQQQQNQKAFSAAFQNIPSTVTTTTKVPSYGVPAYEGIEPFLYRNNVPAQPVPAKGLVEIKPPPGLANFLFKDTEKGSYQLLSDVADATVKAQEAEVAKQNKSISVTQDLLKGKIVPTPLDPMHVYTVPLEPSERAGVLQQLESQKQQLNQEQEKLSKLQQTIAEARKFAGSPLTQEADNQIIDDGIKALSLGRTIERMPMSEVLKKDFESTLKTREKKETRPLTTDEKLAALMESYVKQGGEISPKVIADFKNATRPDSEIIKVGDVMAIRVGNEFKFIPAKEGASIAQLKRSDEQTYQTLLNVAAQTGFERLPEEYKAHLASLNAIYGPSDIISGGKQLVTKVVANRQLELSGTTPQQTPFTVIPSVKPGSAPSRINRFDVQVSPSK